MGRSLATLAELAFVIQWAIVLGSLSEATKTPWVGRVARTTVMLIFVAEIFSWYAVVTTHYLGNVIEESLWAVTFTMVGVSVWGLRARLQGTLKRAATVALFGCAAYVAFMALVDVPMYVGRMLTDQTAQKPLLGFLHGLQDLNTRWHVTRSFRDWRSEMPWQTLYFTAAVWMSLALCYVPLGRERLAKHVLARP